MVGVRLIMRNQFRKLFEAAMNPTIRTYPESWRKFFITLHTIPTMTIEGKRCEKSCGLGSGTAPSSKMRTREETQGTNQDLPKVMVSASASTTRLSQNKHSGTMRVPAIGIPTSRRLLPVTQVSIPRNGERGTSIPYCRIPPTCRKPQCFMPHRLVVQRLESCLAS